ncbi:MAG: DUF1838 family protein [Rhodospirillaceae bacterium]|nr:DUF1838 family protein [Rhodospirillaceae bacterium]MBT6089453.1 DUF1838 family protein [Rhodospirillaceae bacterium]MBT7451408.1 DUF1838 family protein [Rhodospirillaceae bacterium]
MKRRTVITGLAGLAATATFEGRVDAATLPQSLNPADPSHLGLLQKKLIYATDDRPLIWWIRGNKYGSINGELTPLWTLNVVLFKSVSHNEDGSFDAKSMEIVYKTDVETDEPLSKWRNPYNGEVYDEEPLIMGPLSRRFTDAGPISQTELPGAQIQRSGSLGPAEIAGDDVWLISDANVVLSREGQRDFRANDLSTYHGKVSDVLNPDIPSPPSTMAVHIVQSWHPWMNMGDQEGTLITRISGAKCFEVEDIHPRILTMVKQHHPEIAKDFVARLNGPPERFDR